MLRRIVAFFLAAHFSEEYYPYDWLMLWLSKRASSGSTPASSRRQRVPSRLARCRAPLVKTRLAMTTTTALSRPRRMNSPRVARVPRPRIESMVSLGGALSSNFSASDIRSSLDGSAVRKMLTVREEGRPGTHFVSGFDSDFYVWTLCC